MGSGQVTFIALDPTDAGSLSWRAREAISDADIVIWAGGEVHWQTLRLAPAHADIVLVEPESPHALVPYYDLACRDGFRVAHIRSDAPVQWEQLFAHVDKCDELGMRTELIPF